MTEWERSGWEVETLRKWAGGDMISDRLVCTESWGDMDCADVGARCWLDICCASLVPESTLT